MSEIWSVRGVPPTLRRAIVKAAERDGLSVAEWLERRLSGVLGGAAATDTDDSLEGLLSAIDNCLADIEQLDRISH